MTAKITDEIREALQQSDGTPVSIEDTQTQKVYFVYDQSTHEQAMRALRHEQEDIAAIQAGIDAANEGRESTLSEADEFIRREMNFPAAE